MAATAALEASLARHAEDTPSATMRRADIADEGQGFVDGDGESLFRGGGIRLTSVPVAGAVQAPAAGFTESRFIGLGFARRTMADRSAGGAHARRGGRRLADRNAARLAEARFRGDGFLALRTIHGRAKPT
jgi:hypothetical protein